ILFNVWSVLNIFHPPFIAPQYFKRTCHMALPLNIMHFRLSDHLCLKYCGAFRDVNLNYFTHFIQCLECPEHIPPPFHLDTIFSFFSKVSYVSHGPAIEGNAFSPVCRPMFKVLWSIQGRKSELLHTFYLMFGVS